MTKQTSLPTFIKMWAEVERRQQKQLERAVIDEGLWSVKGQYKLDIVIPSDQWVKWNVHVRESRIKERLAILNSGKPIMEEGIVAWHK